MRIPSALPVLVSVKFTPPASFDYALLSGTPALDSNTTFTAGNGGRRSNTHGGANTFVTGKVNVNGNLIMNTKQLCNHGNHQGDFGAVTFLSRAGFADPVTYTRSVTGTAVQISRLYQILPYHSRRLILTCSQVRLIRERPMVSPM